MIDVPIAGLVPVWVFVGVILFVPWALFLYFFVRKKYNEEKKRSNTGVWNHILLFWLSLLFTIALVVITTHYATSTAQMAADYNTSVAILSKDSNSLTEQVEILQKDFELSNRPWLMLRPEFSFELKDSTLLVFGIPPDNSKAEEIYETDISKENINQILLRLSAVNIGKSPAKTTDSELTFFINGKEIQKYRTTFPGRNYFPTQSQAVGTIRFDEKGTSDLFNQCLFKTTCKFEYKLKLKYGPVIADEFNLITNSIVMVEFHEDGILTNLEYTMLE